MSSENSISNDSSHEKLTTREDRTCTLLLSDETIYIWKFNPDNEGTSHIVFLPCMILLFRLARSQVLHAIQDRFRLLD